MIKGIGTDIIEIDRITKALVNPRFLLKYFHEIEIKYFEIKNYAPQTIAGHFACKEAVVKALGCGFRNIAPKDIIITRDNLGKPILFLTDSLLNLMKPLEIDSIHVSISHCKSYAQAVAICEGSK